MGGEPWNISSCGNKHVHVLMGNWRCNLVEIRIPKKFTVWIFILISFQGLSKVFWKCLIAVAKSVTILITRCSSWVHWNGGQFKVDFGLFYLIDAVKGKKISIFLQIWTRKYVCIWNLTCTWSHNPFMPKYPSVCTLRSNFIDF